MRRVVLLLVVFMTLLAGCAEDSDPADTVEEYLKARVASDADKMRQLSCADWEAQAQRDADSFRAMNAEIEDMSCKENGKDGEYTIVKCDGKIVTSYQGGEREWELGSYKLVEDDGEWKICGESE